MLNKLIVNFEKTVSELILFKELVYIVELQQKEIIWIYHDNSLEEYHEIHKTIKAISQLYYFLHMQKKIISYVNKCDLYHKIKLIRHKLYKEIKISLILNWL